MNNLIIGLDLDSVIADTAKVIHKYILDQFGIDMNWDDVRSYHFEDFPGLSSEMVAELKHVIESGYILMDVLPYNTASASTHLLQALDLIVYIITARSNHLEEPTREWLNIHNIAYDELFLAKGVEKYKLIKEYDIKAFVEDRHDVLASIKANHGMLDLGMYLVSQPWNRECKDIDFVRVLDILEAVQEIITRRRSGLLCL